MLRNLLKILSKYQTFHTEDSKLFMENIWITILSSAGIASIISAIVGYVFNVLMQKRKYKDDYYKMVLEKRMNAYVQVEEIYKTLTTSIVNDGKTHCIIFDNEKLYTSFLSSLYGAMRNNIWLSDNINNDLYYLNDMLSLVSKSLNKNGISIQELGEQKQEIFSETHIMIEKHYNQDMMTLHDVKGFLKSKTKKNK